MINENLLLIRNYDPNIPKKEWIDFIVHKNLLGKPSRNWTKELINGVFFPRYVNGTYKDAWQDIKLFDHYNINSNIIKCILYYHTALADEFLYDFISQIVYEKYYSGQIHISSNDGYQFIQQTPDHFFNNPWSDYLKRRLSRGIMATLRDFGILVGKGTKKIGNYYMPLEAFVYISFLIKQKLQSGEKLLKHPDWNLFLLNTKLVERMFLEAHQHKYINYMAAGDIIRIEFPYENVKDLIHAVCKSTIKTT
ncbi:DUF1819 family protein [candidate division KSB1 bacterium]|nr:DUF1819 family protein [candidate division KSB1 bacterium]